LVEFTSRACPRCKELLSVRKLGVWGYFCHRCMFWWGRFEPYPKAGAFKGREDNAPKPKRGRGRPRKRK
ncbi:hypothetical protein COT48_05015, partial [Candidatus Woesearchaeota archaeon CG08_land_8_20_14_0_20_47_9]